MKANQSGAFGLLGFLQSLQQGQDQRLQRQEQYLQEDKQRFDQERQFALAQKAEERAAAEAQRQATLFERGTEEYNKQAPVRNLTTAQTLIAPQQQATKLVGDYEAKRQAIDLEIAKQFGTFNSSRDPKVRDPLRLIIQNLQQNKAQLANSLDQDLGAIAGLTDRSPYLTRFNGVGAKLPNVSGGATEAGAGMPGSNAGMPNGAIIDTNALLDNPLPPMTAADREAILKTANQYNLGATANNFYAYPSVSLRDQVATDVLGNKVTYKVGDIVNQGGGLDYGKFIPANMDSIQAMLQSSVTAGEKLFAKPQEVLTEILGPDESIWPVSIGANGKLIPKEGNQGRSWYETLNPTDKKRVVSTLRPFVNIDEATQRGIDLRYSSSLEGAKSLIEDYRQRRETIMKNAELKFDATSRVNAAAAGRTGNVNQSVDYPIARDEHKAALEDYSRGVASDETIAKGLNAKVPDVIQSIISGHVNGDKVPIAVLAGFYNQRANIANLESTKVAGVPTRTVEEVNAKTAFIKGVRTLANARAKNVMFKYIKDNKASMGEAAFKAAIDWVRSQ
jgi:hypothetical protein